MDMRGCNVVVLLLKALVQMEDLASAVNVIQYYNTIQPSVR